MEEILKNYLNQIKIGGKQVYKNLALFPLLSNLAISLEYLTLDEALAGGLIEVTEKDLGGAVPELQVVNKSPQMVLILDGEELVGAKQNRVVNTTILIKGETTLVIPVSCVEQGRWAYTNPRFESQERHMSANLRANKAVQVHQNLRSFVGFKSNQREIWNDIEEKANRMEARSPSMAMSRIYELNSASLEEYSRNFRPIEGQVGAFFLIDGKVVGLDSFGKPETFSKVFKKLLESYALDAIDQYNPQKEIKVHKSQVTDLLKSAQSAQIESRPSVGLGTDLRLEARKLTGFALATEDQILHLAVFARPANGKKAGHYSRMARFSNRS
jgi:ARG/rhodanese/phosphatase superfamily protein